MRGKNVGLGIFILSLGVVLLLAQLHFVPWAGILYALWKLWPLIFVIIGINVICKRNEIVRTTTWLLFLGIILSYGYYHKDSINFGKWAAFDIDFVDQEKKEEHIKVEKQPETKYGEVKLNLGGGKLAVNSTDNNLVEGSIIDPSIKHSVEYKNGKETAVVKFEKKSIFSVSSGRWTRKCDISLSDDVQWDMDANVGAVDSSLDLRKLQVKELDINIGAAKCDLELGDLLELTNVKINGGATDLDLSVPKSSGVKLKMNGALNRIDFDGIDMQKDNGVYTSSNYEQAKHKIDMEVHLGAGEFTIEAKK